MNQYQSEVSLIKRYIEMKKSLLNRNFVYLIMSEDFSRYRIKHGSVN